MDEEQAIKAEMRLWALENLVCNILTIIATTDPDPDGLMTATRDQMIAGARQRAFSQVDPAMSDLFSAELEAAVARLMDMASSQISGLRRHRGCCVCQRRSKNHILQMNGESYRLNQSKSRS